MKKLTLTLAFALITLFATAQIKEVEASKKPTVIGEVKQMGVFICELAHYDDSKEYLITFRNAEYKTIIDIKSISFEGTQDDLDNLYNLFSSVLNGEKGNEKIIEIGTDKIRIINSKIMGTTSIYVYVDNKGYFMLDKKWLNKLFNKS